METIIRACPLIFFGIVPKGIVKIKEIASKTHKLKKVTERNVNKLAEEGISGSVSVSNTAVRLNNIVERVKGWF